MAVLRPGRQGNSSMNKKKDGSRFDDLIGAARSRTQEEIPQPTEM